MLQVLKAHRPKGKDGYSHNAMAEGGFEPRAWDGMTREKTGTGRKGGQTPLAWDGLVPTGGLGHKRGRGVEVGQLPICSRGHRTDPAPRGHAFRWGFLGGRPRGGMRQNERSPGSKALAP